MQRDLVVVPLLCFPWGPREEPGEQGGLQMWSGQIHIWIEPEIPQPLHSPPACAAPEEDTGKAQPRRTCYRNTDLLGVL